MPTISRAIRALSAVLAILVVTGSVASAYVPDFAHAGTFESVNAFVASAQEFHASALKRGRSALFTVPELGQPDDPKTGRPVLAPEIKSCVVLWFNEANALVFVRAEPPTEATRSVVGVLFLLHHTRDHWRIADHRKFVASGKYAEVSAELSADVGTGYQLASEGMLPVITIKESQGGRGYSYQMSASYTFRRSKLLRMALN